MELSLPIIAVPAIIALMFKAAIYAYARLSSTHNLTTRLYLLFLFSLSIQNISEIFIFYSLNVNNAMPYFKVKLFYAATIAAIGFLFHLAFNLAFDDFSALLHLQLGNHASGFIVFHSVASERFRDSRLWNRIYSYPSAGAIVFSI